LNLFRLLSCPSSHTFLLLYLLLQFSRQLATCTAHCAALFKCSDTIGAIGRETERGADDDGRRKQ
jgi:hypothetical protein